jgi:multimeric flavodoxin WrbA
MKVIAILGSPRPNGNSAVLAREVLARLMAAGAQVQVQELNRLTFKGCQGCGACKTTSEACVIEDDFTPLYEAVREADVLLLASPVYFGDLSGQLKCFFDRFYAFANPDFTSRLAPGKKSVFILTQGAPPPEMFDDIHPRYERWLKHFGFGPNHLVRGLGLQEAGEVAQRPELLARAREVADRLLAGQG